MRSGSIEDVVDGRLRNWAVSQLDKRHNLIMFRKA